MLTLTRSSAPPRFLTVVIAPRSIGAGQQQQTRGGAAARSVTSIAWPGEVLSKLPFNPSDKGADSHDAAKLPPAPPSAVVLSAIKAVAQGQSAEGEAMAGTASNASHRSEVLLIALLNSNAGACRRIAASVDTRTAEEWAKAREGAEEAAAADEVAQGLVPPPTRQQMLRLHVRSAVPFVGFGFFDNMIMLTVGGAIENTIGVALGLTSLAAAGMGQMVSDACGITLQGLIERFADRLGLPHPKLSLKQQKLKSVQSFILASRIFGIFVGCGLGMFPLLLMPEPPHRKLVDEIADKLPRSRREEFMSSVDTRHFQNGEYILTYKEMSNYVLFIESGQVKCEGRDADGLPFQVCMIEPGHSFGKPQLHCASQVDLIAIGDVVVEYMEKDDFLRVGGLEGMEVWENTQNSEHTVYFSAQGSRISDPVAPAVQGTGKTRMFASLPSADKLLVLEAAGVLSVEAFRGKPKEGKCAVFAALPEDVKHDALAQWHRAKFGAPGQLVGSQSEVPTSTQADATLELCNLRCAFPI